MRNILSAIALAITTTGALAADPNIEPGLYEIVTKTDVGPAQTERKCLSTADIVKGLQSNPGPGCKAVRSVVAGGKLDFATTCPDMAMTMTGTYSPTSYTIDGKIEMKDDGETTTIQSHIKATKVGACKS